MEDVNLWFVIEMLQASSELFKNVTFILHDMAQLHLLFFGFPLWTQQTTDWSKKHQINEKLSRRLSSNEALLSCDLQ